jgi:hypothetical protein
MQIINGYDSVSQQRNFMLDFRLFHLDRPRILECRRQRHGYQFCPDFVDHFVIDFCKDKKLVAVDCGGWYFEYFGFEVQCFESVDLSKLYNKNCFVEYDLKIHKPTYVNPDPVLLRHPWFLKYATVEQLVAFLELWCDQPLILNFDTKFLQYNHLKFQLADLVQARTNLNIHTVSSKLWLITNTKL